MKLADIIFGEITSKRIEKKNDSRGSTKPINLFSLFERNTCNTHNVTKNTHKATKKNNTRIILLI